VGDSEWSNLLGRHDALVRAQFLRHQGREVKHTGDGLLAAFDGPARAVRCGLAIQRSLRDLDLSVRVGIHTGECELRGDDLAGIAVHIAARVCSLAAADEVLASATVRDLVVGSGLRFEDRGSHQLKGIDQPWPIVAALDE
jgi:class 3 adenylate cyclase